MNITPLPTHGIYTLPWDHAALPDDFWRRTKRQPNGCWRAKWEDASGDRSMIVLRLMGVNPMKDAWFIVPTCGDVHCVNPAHLCITLRGPNSSRELDPHKRSR